jgi:hypothetical protein
LASGFLRVVSPEVLSAVEAERQAAAAEQAHPAPLTDAIAHHVRSQFDIFRRHRTSASITERLLAALRAYNGEYDPAKRQEILSFGGSDVYARLTAIKCRGASAILREVYLGPERPWVVEPTPEPDLPVDIAEAVNTLISSEIDTLLQAGQVPNPTQVQTRRDQLMKAAREAAQKQARDQARLVTSHIEDDLVEGRFYKALAAFLLDLPVFPFAVIKGPVVQMQRVVEYKKGKAVVKERPRMFWKRVSPFDFYWTPGASSFEEADIIERDRLRRSDLQALIGVPGYDSEAIKEALIDYQNGHTGYHDDNDTERADQEDRENPYFNQSHMISTLEFQGEIPGQLLMDWNNGQAVKDIDDFEPAFDYNVVAWIVGRHTIKVRITPNPRVRHNYYATSFEKVAGSCVGRALPEILADSQHVANASFRALVNNLSISSGPQVVLNEDRLSPSTTGERLYPWKIWKFLADPLAVSGEKPIDFFQPGSNANELMGVFEKMMMLSDEVSGIPRYMTGEQRGGGAASTASGLSMLMNNASKVLQQVASQIDGDILEPALSQHHDLLLLTDKGQIFHGDDTIRVRGATMSMVREANRQRQLEFLQLTANPLDSQIVGSEGRATLLRSISGNLGLDGDSIVPSEEQVLERQRQAQTQAQAQAQQQAAAQAQGGQAPAPGPLDDRVARPLDNAQRTRTPAAMAAQTQP